MRPRYLALCAFAFALVVAIAPASTAEQARGLTLNAALQRALAANPKLVAADRDVGIATGKHIQAGAIPNPEVSFELDNVFGTGDYRGLNSAEKTIGIGQLIVSSPLGLYQ